MYVYTHTNTHFYIQEPRNDTTLSLPLSPSLCISRSMPVSESVSMRMYIYIIRKYVCVYIYIHVFIARTYIFIYVYMYICTHTHTHRDTKTGKWASVDRTAPNTAVRGPPFAGEAWKCPPPHTSCSLCCTTPEPISEPKAPCSFVVHTWALQGLPYHNFKENACTITLHGAFGTARQGGCRSP